MCLEVIKLSIGTDVLSHEVPTFKNKIALLFFASYSDEVWILNDIHRFDRVANSSCDLLRCTLRPSNRPIFSAFRDRPLWKWQQLLSNDFSRVCPSDSKLRADSRPLKVRLNQLFITMCISRAHFLFTILE